MWKNAPLLTLQTDLRQALFAHARTVAAPFVVSRGELLQAPGQQHSSLYLVENGAAQVFYNLRDGTRQTLRFGYPGEIIAALPGFFLGVSSPLGIEALRHCDGYRMSRAEVVSFCESTPERVAAYTAMLERFACGLVEREIDLLEPDPARRYASVLRRSPQLFEHVPLRYIASYLRMTPETLSRVRRKQLSANS